MRQKHTIDPFYDANSEILILGTMPSPKSREMGFYYMHSRNRFWTLLGLVFNEKIGEKIKDKKEFLKRHKIALWDVCASCNIVSASDSSIKNVKVNDINKVIKNSNIKYIYTTGKKAFELYNRYLFKKIKIEAICLYSPSPTNCAISLEKMLECYQVIKK